MATYTETTPAKPGIGTRVRLGVVAFAVAALVVIAVMAMERGSSAPTSRGTDQVLVQTNGAGGGSGQDHGIGQGSAICAEPHGWIAAECAP
jgi:hypothetical protein